MNEGDAIGTKDVARVRKRAKRDLILDEAARQFNSRGISEASLTEISAALGLSRAALYYYAKDRQDLVCQCYLRACEQLTRHAMLSAQGDGSALDRICGFVERCLDPEQAEEAVFAEVAYLNDEQRDIIEDRIGGILTALVRLIEQGQSEGSIRRCDPIVIAQALMGIVSWIPLAPRWIDADPVAIKRRSMDAAIDLLRNGVATSPRTFAPGPRIDLALLRAPRGNVFSRADAAAMKLEELLRVSSLLFNRKGIDATSLDEIGAAVGATKGAVYHYLSDKPELVAQCYRRAFDLGDRIIAVVGEAGGGPLIQATASYRLLVEINARAEFSPLAPLAGIDALKPGAHDEVVALARRSQETFPSIVEKAISDGSARSIDIVGAATVLAGTFGWIPKWFDGEDDAMATHIADELETFYLAGIAAR